MNFIKKFGFIEETEEIKENPNEFNMINFSYKMEPKCGICNKQLNLKIYKSKKNIDKIECVNHSACEIKKLKFEKEGVKDKVDSINKNIRELEIQLMFIKAQYPKSLFILN